MKEAAISAFWNHHTAKIKLNIRSEHMYKDSRLDSSRNRVQTNRYHTNQIGVA